MLSVEGGVCVSIEERGLIICIGDARVSAGSQGAGSLRGTVVELFRKEELVSDSDGYTQEEADEDEAWMQSVLVGLFKGTDVSFSAKILTSRTEMRDSNETAGTKKKPDWSLVKLYMSVFRR